MVTKRASKKKSTKLPALRIIGGQWRGRKLPFQEADGLRPTGDRVRETLFNWLQWDIRGSRCLDLFAGSGALGFEAASRGAASVVMVEKNAATARQLTQNCALLQAGDIAVVPTDAYQFLRSESSGFDIVFVDPPFALQQANDVCAAIELSGLLSEKAHIYVELPREQPCEVPANWSMLKSGRAGQVVSRLFIKDEPART